MASKDKELEKIKQKMVKDLMSHSPNATGEVHVLKSDEIADFIKNNKYVMIDFYSTHCAPCRMVAPIIEEIAQEMKEKVAFSKVNTMHEPKAAMEYRIRFVPTFYLFKEGKPVTQFSGAKPKKNLLEIIDKAFFKEEE